MAFARGNDLWEDAMFPWYKNSASLEPHKHCTGQRAGSLGEWTALCSLSFHTALQMDCAEWGRISRLPDRLSKRDLWRHQKYLRQSMAKGYTMLSLRGSIKTSGQYKDLPHVVLSAAIKPAFPPFFFFLCITSGWKHTLGSWKHHVNSSASVSY